jgi:hypothetical protein
MEIFSQNIDEPFEGLTPVDAGPLVDGESNHFRPGKFAPATAEAM